ncbi:MAG: hypothetical protein JOZ38_01650 [Candidatus Eremiobacteraeota bacterium]|nr:hypothetical protein [Candidatus Eremiobacteraeota bacterium]
MGAHQRIHPYDLQTLALFVAFVPCFLAMFLAFAGRHVEELGRLMRRPCAATLRLRASLPSLDGMPALEGQAGV